MGIKVVEKSSKGGKLGMFLAQVQMSRFLYPATRASPCNKQRAGRKTHTHTQSRHRPPPGIRGPLCVDIPQHACTVWIYQLWVYISHTHPSLLSTYHPSSSAIISKSPITTLLFSLSFSISSSVIPAQTSPLARRASMEERFFSHSGMENSIVRMGRRGELMLMRVRRPEVENRGRRRIRVGWEGSERVGMREAREERDTRRVCTWINICCEQT